MDNRITKSRLSNFFAYEWIALVAIAVCAIFLWELIYTMAGVRLTTGQQFKYYYDETLYSQNKETLRSTLIDDDTFSYDVLEISHEALTSEYNVLSTRLTVQEGDAIFTDIIPTAVEGSEYKARRANQMIDAYQMFAFEDLVESAKRYLFKFIDDTKVGNVAFDEAGDLMLTFDNLSAQKIKDNFLSRMRKDNRFRKDAEKEQGIKDETARIEKLCVEVLFLQTELEKDALRSEDDKYFYRYRRFEYSVNVGSEEDKASYTDEYAEEVEKSYGLKIENLVPATGQSKLKNTDYFMVRDSSYAQRGADDVVALIFDFESYQPDLQFETICFLNSLIRIFTETVQ
ncbi:MAG: hypothetical protein E7369_03795 [Clostridiales bacterium]|nr:hypothetical protein [Clostridiales bacterium]